MKIKNMILTAVCICFLCLFGSVQVYAAEYYGDFQYEENGENVSIYAYNGSDKEVTIPAYINDKAVTEINDYAFLLCNSVEKIIVPSTVTTIHANAFFGAGNLKSVVLASSDTKIEDSYENTDENGKSDSSNTADNKNDIKNTGSDSTSPAKVTTQYKVTVDSSIDTAAEEKKLAKQYNSVSNSENSTVEQNNDTAQQNNGTEIAGIDDGLDADEIAISSNADTASGKSQSMLVWGIVLIVAVAAIAVAGTLVRKRVERRAIDN